MGISENKYQIQNIQLSIFVLIWYSVLTFVYIFTSIILLCTIINKRFLYIINKYIYRSKLVALRTTRNSNSSWNNWFASSLILDLIIKNKYWDK